MFIRRERTLWYLPTFYLILMGFSLAMVTAILVTGFSMPGMVAWVGMALPFFAILTLVRRVSVVGDRVAILRPGLGTLHRERTRLHGQVSTNGVGFRVALVTEEVDTIGWTMTKRGADRVVEKLLAVAGDLPRATVRR